MKKSPVRPVITNINDLTTSQIIWHLAKRHAIVLLVATNVLTLTVWLVKSAPAALNSAIK